MKNSSPTIIAFTGRKQVGKDFLASHLITVYGGKRCSFSDGLKTIANSIFPWCQLDYEPSDKEIVIENENNSGCMSPRDIWKSLDTLRNIDANVFVHAVEDKISKLIENGQKLIVITDIRKAVEFDLMRKLDATIIKICGDAPKDPDEHEIDGFVADFEFYHDKSGHECFDKFLHKNKILGIDYE